MSTASHAIAARKAASHIATSPVPRVTEIWDVRLSLESRSDHGVNQVKRRRGGSKDADFAGRSAIWHGRRSASEFRQPHHAISAPTPFLAPVIVGSFRRFEYAERLFRRPLVRDIKKQPTIEFELYLVPSMFIVTQRLLTEGPSVWMESMASRVLEDWAQEVARTALPRLKYAFLSTQAESFVPYHSL
jgi:hypothetical protein